MSIEIRTFDGSAEQLSSFVVETWLKSYAGKMPVPDWHARYFDWQMTGSQYADRDYLVTAWDNGNLVGCILGIPFPIWYFGEERQGSQGSWLTVSAEARRSGVARMMVDELDRRQREKNCLGRIGYAYQGSKLSLGPRFWLAARKKSNHIRPVRLWARLLNSDAVRNWTNHAMERFLLKVLPNSVCSIGRVNPAHQMREYRDADLETCRELINHQAKQTDLGVLWTPERLRSQLQYEDFVNTILFEREGQVKGFINYHKLPLTLCGTISAAIIDLYHCELLNHRENVSFLNSYFLQMREEGVKIILLREFAAQPTRALLQTRFVPQANESTLLFSRSDSQTPSSEQKVRRFQVLWR
ncbi:MAG: GNAT family N-acetyltransferase [Planctomycetaceae bacterium]|nr:GNAT family N-acetyltransferase [Planctomycetaceae bacterium]